MSVVAQEPHELVWTLTNAVVASTCLHLVAELGVADHVEDEPVQLAELAADCGANLDALERILRLLAAHGIFEHSGSRYAHTASSRLLRTDHPMSMRAFARMMGLPVFSSAFAHLSHSLRTGSPGLEKVEPKGLWGYLEAHPAQAEIFGEAMTAKARAEIAAVLDAYDFSQHGTIADIGGGRGHLLRAVVDAAPAVHGVLFDLPGVIDTLAIAGDRLSARGGDFFVDQLPSADAYILMEVLHDWDDARAGAILRAIRDAASPGATLLIIEGVVCDQQADPRVLTLDVIMLSITGGRERSARRFAELLHGAGFSLSADIATSGPMRIIEALAI